MTVQEITEELNELETLPAHEELAKLREVIPVLIEKCVEAADLRFPGLGKIVNRCVQREAQLSGAKLKVFA